MKKLNKKGFTIVELVIVIAVIAILAAVLIPTFSNVIENANEVADLQEARNTMQAYNAHITEVNKGQAMADGVVFKVEKTGTTFVYYKNELHKFKGKAVSEYDGAEDGMIIDDLVKPLTKIDNEYVALDGAFDTFVEGEVSTTAGKKVIFFYSMNNSVVFEDGSAKCKVYPGIAIQVPTQADHDYVAELDAAFEDHDIEQGYSISLSTDSNSKLVLETVGYKSAQTLNITISTSDTTAVAALTTKTYKIGAANAEDIATLGTATVKDEISYYTFIIDAGEGNTLNSDIIITLK